MSPWVLLLLLAQVDRRQPARRVPRTLTAPSASAAVSPLRVGHITVRNAPLFDANEANGGFYRMANALAVRTRERLIRRFLLIREGEPYDEARLRESERNLRALDFLKSVSIKPAAPHDGVVDVLVETQDEWTTDVNVDYSNDGRLSVYEFDVDQKDLFGTGAEADVRFGKGRERSTRSIELLHPALFGAYWNGDAFYARNSDGNEERLAIERPLFSYTQRYTGVVSFDHLLRNSRIYANGEVASLFRQEHREATIAYGPIVAATHNSTTRIVVGADVLRDSFTPLSGPAPDNRRFQFIEAGIDHTASNYLKLDHVDYGMRVEDFNLGAQASLYAGISAGIYRIRGEASIGRHLAPTAFVLSRLTATARAGDINRNTIFSSDTRLVVRSGQTYPRTFVARLRIDIGSDVDRDVQFFADGPNGLRAYPNFAFAGTKRVVYNVEERVFLGREWLHVFEPGAAVFVDSGEALNGSLALRAMHTDVGAGLRFSIARFESAMFRLDVAYAFNNSPLSKRGIVFSVATTQAF